MEQARERAALPRRTIRTSDNDKSPATKNREPCQNASAYASSMTPVTTAIITAPNTLARTLGRRASSSRASYLAPSFPCAQLDTVPRMSLMASEATVAASASAAVLRVEYLIMPCEATPTTSTKATSVELSTSARRHEKTKPTTKAVTTVDTAPMARPSFSDMAFRTSSASLLMRVDTSPWAFCLSDSTATPCWSTAAKYCALEVGLSQ